MIEIKILLLLFSIGHGLDMVNIPQEMIIRGKEKLEVNFFCLMF